MPAEIEVQPKIREPVSRLSDAELVVWGLYMDEYSVVLKTSSGYTPHLPDISGFAGEAPLRRVEEQQKRCDFVIASSIPNFEVRARDRVQPELEPRGHRLNLNMSSTTQRRSLNTQRNENDYPHTIPEYSSDAVKYSHSHDIKIVEYTPISVGAQFDIDASTSSDIRRLRRRPMSWWPRE
ncbi:hypothetical protein SISNIDRAFT_465107 [Sistotremastrum niveocremeum HHB9708]|uniref:Uncharacterized protein n=1 Tax=Sistotremastrum niveocremeum HHB9708 TaxID=1314777 RepID=A0A164W977_9AGAM|nr:hypothetical protein SISNIDRAFT_465107 [Sistotremastrum niveocremeum HHB9708]